MLLGGRSDFSTVPLLRRSGDRQSQPRGQASEPYWVRPLLSPARPSAACESASNADPCRGVTDLRLPPRPCCEPDPPSGCRHDRADRGYNARPLFIRPRKRPLARSAVASCRKPTSAHDRRKREARFSRTSTVHAPTLLASCEDLRPIGFSGHTFALLFEGKGCFAALEAARAWSPRVMSRLEAHIRSGDDAALFRINPMQFARERGVPETEAVDLFLHGTAHGLFKMDWLLLCPCAPAWSKACGSATGITAPCADAPCADAITSSTSPSPSRSRCRRPLAPSPLNLGISHRPTATSSIG